MKTSLKERLKKKKHGCLMKGEKMGHVLMSTIEIKGKNDKIDLGC